VLADEVSDRPNWTLPRLQDEIEARTGDASGAAPGCLKPCVSAFAIPINCQRMGDRAGVVEQILAVSGVAARRVGTVGEQDEAGPTTIKRRADHHQRFGRHVVPRGLHSLGKQAKGIDPVKIGRVDASRHVVSAVEIEGQRRPGLAKCRSMAKNTVPHVGPDAVDVNVQLVLTSGEGRIDRHADGIPGQFALCPPRDVGPCLPCGTPVFGASAARRSGLSMPEMRLVAMSRYCVAPRKSFKIA
jgi:hypothetical protein